MDLEPRTGVPSHATGAVGFVALAEVAADATFKLREEGDVSALASSLGRLGQLVPVELRPLPGAQEGGKRWQVVAGFRRLAAIRLLRRDRVLARVHPTLSDEDAWALALAQALLTAPLDGPARGALRDRAAAFAPWALELLDEVVNEPEPAAEVTAAGEAIEVTPEELANDLAARLYEVNADLMLAFEAWADLPDEGRRAIVEQARWIAALLPRLGDEEEER